MSEIKYIENETIEDKRILLRVDYNVSMDENHTISDDARITQSLPTIKLLLPKNKIIIISHLDRPKGRDPQLSLKPVVEKLKQYLPDTKITLVEYFENDHDTFANQQDGEIVMLENIRFYEGEDKNDPEFAKQLAALGDVFVNDAFAVSHRASASIVGIPKLLPAYCGLLLAKENKIITKAIENPEKPLVAILGGAKVSDKIKLIGRLIEIADHVLLGGGLANPFLAAAGFKIGKSICEPEMIDTARNLLDLAAQKNTDVVFPIDVMVGDPNNKDNSLGKICKTTSVPDDQAIYDIGPETEAAFGAVIARAKTIIWNGPVGVFENPEYRAGTDFIYYSIAHNPDAVSILGGGDTLAAISKKEYIDKITHISTGGGAMLELIEKGTLPGLDALKQ